MLSKVTLIHIHRQTGRYTYSTHTDTQTQTDTWLLLGHAMGTLKNFY